MARVDHLVIADMVPHGAKVLDVGCGDGELLQLLQREKNAKARGLEISQDGVNACVAKGLSVVQGDADRDLAFFPDRAFDVVILSKTIQAVRNPKAVLGELMRVADRAIVSMPNFGHWKVRLALLATGKMPVTETLPASWHESENIHLCTVRDFVELATGLGIHLERAVPISGDAAGAPFAKSLWRANLTAEDVVFLLAAR